MTMTFETTVMYYVAITDDGNTTARVWFEEKTDAREYFKGIRDKAGEIWSITWGSELVPKNMVTMLLETTSIYDIDNVVQHVIE